MLRTREDLPVARRQQASKSPRPFPIGPVVLSVSLALGGGLAALFLLQEQLLERWMPPAGLVEGIDAKPDRFGRLLGHFPYPEASTDQLVELIPGFQMQPDAAAAYTRMSRAAGQSECTPHRQRHRVPPRAYWIQLRGESSEL